MNDLTLEAQGLAALGAWRKILRSFEVVRRKMSMVILQSYRHHVWCTPVVVGFDPGLSW